MSTSAPQKPGSPPVPLAPPDEQFWDKYSPHHEFPLSSVGSVALHIGGLALLAGLLFLAYRSTTSDKTPVPMRVMTVTGGEGPGGAGGGGGDQRAENIDPVDQAIPKRDVPQAELDKVIPDLKQFLPKVPSVRDGLRPDDLPNVPKIVGLDEELRRRLLEGASGNKGKGPGDGSGGAGPEGPGAGSDGDPTSSANRGVRWELNFKTSDGKDYLEQLRVMKATLLIPQPGDWKTYKAYNLSAGGLTGEDFDTAKLPGLYFIDDDPGSASRLVRAMGLGFSPPKFLAFFPKDIEEELAAKERDFRGRKEGEIFSTSFRILIRDGKPTIQVISQQAVRK